MNKGKTHPKTHSGRQAVYTLQFGQSFELVAKLVISKYPKRDEGAERRLNPLQDEERKAWGPGKPVRELTQP